MKKIIGYVIVGIASFFAGGAAGYLMRKKTEVTFEEVTEEEQEKAMAADSDIHRPLDIEEAINKTFGIAGHKPYTPYTQSVFQNEMPEKTVENKTDQQKESIFKQWKTEDKPESSEDDDDPGAGIDEELLEQMIAPVRHTADIEEATFEDWHHWMDVQDGDYDPVEIWWFDEDNVLTDENGEVIENPGKFIGFDVAEKFDEIDEATTGDPDIRIVYNHKQSVIFQILRKHASYNRKSSMEEYGDDGEDDERDWIQSRV